MRHFFTTVFAVLFAFAALGQTIVSTETENRKVILEEFTGIYCGYCPQGHAIAESIMANNPGNAFAVNIHTGSFANPQGNDPDFRTPFGTAIANQSGLTGYPAGTVNRHLFSSWSQGSGTAMGRNYWSSAANLILGEESYVNVAMEAEIDVANRELTVLAEVYYTGDSPEATNFLNIALLQDNTVGYQAGGSPTYNHMHRLVWMITDQWGDEITTTTTGSFVSRTYTYTIPEDYNGIEAELTDLNLVGFISETTQEIPSGNACTPTFTNYPYDIKLKSVNTPENVCGETIESSVSVQNISENEISELTLEYSVNGETTYTYSWTGSIASLETAEIVLPEVAFTPADVNSFDVAIIISDDNPDNNTGSSEFSMAPEGTMHVFLNLYTDGWGDECTWNITNSAGTILESGGPYGDNVNIRENFWIDPDCNSFNLFDSYGDGGGAVTLTDSEGTQLFHTSGNYGSGASQLFNTFAIPPTVSSNPGNGDTDVSINADIIISFDQAVRMPDDSPISDPASVVSFTDADGNPVAFSAVIDAEQKVITLTPDVAMELDAEYTVFIAAGAVENNWDLALEVELTSTFTTQTEIISVSNINSDAFVLYPNPAKNTVKIDVPANYNIRDITISNAFGKELMKIDSNVINSGTSVDISQLANGVYFCTFLTENGSITKRIVVTK